MEIIKVVYLPSPDAPFRNTVLALSAEPVILFDAEPSYHEQADSNRRGI